MKTNRNEITEKDLVSIIIPVYNVSKYIEKCICSVVCQTYKNIECVIVDDNSNDDSIAKAKAITGDYNGTIKFVYLNHNTHRGVGATRNTGTEAARGEWIYYLDSDDEIVRDGIEKLYEAAQKHSNADVVPDVVQGNARKESLDGQLDYDCDISKYGLPDRFVSNEEIRESFYGRKSKWPTTVWNKLIRREFIVNNNLSFKEGVIHEDEHWMFYFIKHLSDVIFVTDVTYIYKVRSNSIMTNNDYRKSADCTSKIVMDFLDGLDDKSYRLQYDYAIYFSNHWYVRYPNEFEFKEAYRRMWAIAKKNKYIREAIVLTKLKIKSLYFKLFRLNRPS